MQIATVHTGDADQMKEIVARAATTLEAGGLVVFPTETVYGIAASAASARGVDALRSFKDRPDGQPFTIHLPNPSQAGRYVDVSRPPLRRLIEKAFPGPITLVVDVEEAVIEEKLDADGLSRDLRGRLYHENTVGLRCPDMPVARQVLAAVEAPVVASSANLRGQPPPMDAQAAADAVGDSAGLIIDGGRCRYAKPSTIVRVGLVHGRLKLTVERSGVYDERYIRKLLRWTVVFVCSGNTCRSPMAEGLAKRVLAEKRGLGIDDLESAGIRVVSAGASAAPGMAASPEAVDVMRRVGVDLAKHRSQPLRPELIHEADAIFCMTRAHRHEVLRLAPSAEEKAVQLDPTGDIDDPIGFDDTVYMRCAELIRRRVESRLNDLGL